MSFPIHPLDKALGDITSIRRQVARTTEFRGYGAATLAATGVFAILAAVTQAIMLPNPANHIGNYLRIWITTAILSAVLIGMSCTGPRSFPPKRLRMDTIGPTGSSIAGRRSRVRHCITAHSSTS